jgi:hypothetical protein
MKTLRLVGAVGSAKATIADVAGREQPDPRQCHSGLCSQTLNDGIHNICGGALASHGSGKRK